ncbi:MAG TPA: M23 family metallopeptidase [Paenibacillaceae bacterium]
MNDQNDKNVRKLDPSAKPGESDTASGGGWKRLFARRWVFPALYMVAAALIVTLLWLYTDQNRGTDNPAQATPEAESAAETRESPEAAPVIAGGETLRWPVRDVDRMVVARPYYDLSAPAEERAAAIVERDNLFTPHMAVDIASPDQQPFEVLAAMSGTVKVAQEDGDNGFVAEIEHPGGYVTVYKSLAELRVRAGDKIDQGDVIGIAGKSAETGDKGPSVHFEIRHNGKTLNPEAVIQDE